MYTSESHHEGGKSLYQADKSPRITKKTERTNWTNFRWATENVPRKINIRLSMEGQNLFDNSSLFLFSPSSAIWKGKNFLRYGWIISHGGMNTRDLVSVIWKNAAETSDHPLLHCPIALSLWRRLFRNTQLNWYSSFLCYVIGWEV